MCVKTELLTLTQGGTDMMLRKNTHHFIASLLLILICVTGLQAAPANKSNAKKPVVNKTTANEKTKPAKSVEEIKSAARKAAAKRLRDKKIAAFKVAKAVAEKDATALKAFIDQAISEKIAGEQQRAEQAIKDEAAAKTALAEKEAVVKTATAKFAVAQATARKTPANKKLARISKNVKREKDRAERDRLNAANTLRSAGYTIKSTTTLVEKSKSALAKISATQKSPIDLIKNKKNKKIDREIQAFVASAIMLKVDGEKVLYEKSLRDKIIVQRVIDKRKATARKAAQRVAATKKSAGKKYEAAKVAAAKATALMKSSADKMASIEKEIQTAAAKYYEARFLISGGLKLLPANQWDVAKARHLLCRAGFGGTPEEVKKLHAMGLHRAVEYLVDYQNQPSMDIPFKAVLPERANRDERYLEFKRRRELINRRRRADAIQENKLRDWWLQRMVQSPRPLEEKLTLFWHGHFSTEYRTVRNSYAMYEQNQMLRERANGNFGVLLRGIIRDPAMIRYLDNNSNVKGRPNENLAREIMELFSLGVGNYTEEDIMEGARALTGYTYDTATSQFRFSITRHDAGKKTIFGQTGNWTGDDFVELILRQPATSRFIARKLFVFFVYENPDPEYVHRMATVLKKEQYDLSPLLKNLFMSEVFYSPDSMGNQVKSPIQLAVGTLRDLGVKEVSYAQLGKTTADMGQEIFGPPNVRGWEGGKFWVNANRIFVRYNGIADIVDRVPVPGKSRGLDLVAVLKEKNIRTSTDVVNYLATSCFVKPLSAAKIKELVDFLGPLPEASKWESQHKQINAKLQSLLILMMSMPEYQCT